MSGTYSTSAIVVENNKKIKGVLTLSDEGYEFNGNMQPIDWATAYCDVGAKKVGALTFLTLSSYVTIYSAYHMSPEFVMELDQVDEVLAKVSELCNDVRSARKADEERRLEEAKAQREKEAEEERLRLKEEARLRKEAERQRIKEEKKRWVLDPNVMKPINEEEIRKAEAEKKAMQAEARARKKAEESELPKQEERPAGEPVAEPEDPVSATVIPAPETTEPEMECSELQTEPAEEASEEFSTEAPAEPAPEKKSIFKRVWFWIAAALLLGGIVVAIVLISSGRNVSYSSPASYIDPYVRMVKTAEHSTYGITYGAAFNSFFSVPSWESFISTSGEHVVEFQGLCYSSDKLVPVQVQFLIESDYSSFTVAYVSINGESQNILGIALFVKKIFESY